MLFILRPGHDIESALQLVLHFQYAPGHTHKRDVEVRLANLEFAKHTKHGRIDDHFAGDWMAPGSPMQGEVAVQRHVELAFARSLYGHVAARTVVNDFWIL